MVLVVFLLAYLVRRKLDAANAWSSETLWRSAFNRGGAERSGNCLLYTSPSPRD